MAKVDFRLATYALCVPILLFHVLSICGCISDSPGLPNIFLIELQMGNENDQVLRVGYLGLCALLANQTQCRISAGASAEAIQIDFGLLPESLDTIRFALTVQSTIFIYLPAVSGCLFLLATLLLVLLKRSIEKNTAPNAKTIKRQKGLRFYAFGHLYASAAFALTTATGVAQATAAMQSLSALVGHNGISVEVYTGVTLQVLEWLAFGALALFAVGILVIMKGTNNVASRPTKVATRKVFKDTSKGTTSKTGKTSVVDPLAMLY